ncbi:MAG: biopolymer transporter ExbD [Verrucomicrobiaceae bacterium]
MKRVSNQRQLRLISEISVTPMLDLVLMLLFVFLLVAPVLHADKEWMSSAPGSAPAARQGPPEMATLTVHRDESIKLNGAMLARADLPSFLKQLTQREPDLGVEVRIHRDLPVERLVDTMQMLEAAGIRHTAVTTHADDP